MLEMTLLRKAILALAGAIIVLSLGQMLLMAQGLPGMMWPTLLLRLMLLAFTVPAMVVQFWVALHLNLHLPTLPLVWALFLAYAQLWTGLRRLRAGIDMPARPGRRAFLASSGVVAVSGYGLLNNYPNPEITRLPLPLADLPPGLVGCRLVLLSDLHRGPAISQSYLKSVVRTVNGLKPDLILLPGDFVSKSSAYFPDVTAVLSQLRPRIASLATLGNHDHWEGTEQAKQAITRAGVLLLHNSSVHLDENGRLSTSGDRGLCLAGVDDLGAGQPDLAAALAGVSQGVPTILLSHNPDFAEEEKAKSSSARVDLQLSGHTHGGQVVLPGAGPLVSGSRYGMKYLSGLVQGPRWPVFVTRGIGASVAPLRIGSPPEIVVFELSCLEPMNAPRHEVLVPKDFRSELPVSTSV
jgi:predicted MPP superfamily phosphohydrolase